MFEGGGWGATSPKGGTNKTRPQTLNPARFEDPNTQSGAVWGRGWRCSKLLLLN
jgi:hypothetical protein